MMLDTVDEKKGVYPLFNITDYFIVTAVNYADRATLSIAGTEVAKSCVKCGFDGYIFCFWLAPFADANSGGWLLDKFGRRSLHLQPLFWSLFTFLQGFVDMFPLAWAGSAFFMRFMLGSRKRHHSRRTPVLSPPGS